MASANAAYRVVAKVKNNRLLRALEQMFPEDTTQADWSRRIGVSQSDLGRLLNMQYWPALVLKSGEVSWTGMALKIAAAVAHRPEYLFDPALYHGQVPNRVSVEIGPAELAPYVMRALPPSPEETYTLHERAEVIGETLEHLTPKEEYVLNARYGLDGSEPKKYDEIGLALRLSRERVRQIELRALKKLRHPKFSRLLREYLPSIGMIDHQPRDDKA